MYTTATDVRLLVQDLTAEDVDDPTITAISNAFVVPYINGKLNGGATIASPSAMVKAIDAHLTCCAVVRRIYRRLQTDPPKGLAALCEQGEEWLTQIVEGVISDSSVTVGQQDYIHARDPLADALEAQGFVGGELNWEWPEISRETDTE